MLKRSVVSILAIVAVCIHLTASAATVDFFSPQGEVARVRQVTARFDEQMVEFGDPRAADPFDVSCAEKGSGRWIDGRNWSYDFERDVPAGIRCAFTLKAGLRSLKGNAAAAKTFVFATGGPKIVRSWPSRGARGIREEQPFLLELNVPAQESSVRDNTRCLVRFSGEEIPVALLPEPEMRALEKLNLISPKDTRPRLALKCARSLPSNTAVDLVWGKAIASQSGVTSERDQVVDFVVRPPLTATSSCQTAGAIESCNPARAISLTFSAPMPRAVAGQARLRMPDGTLRAPDALPAAATTVQRVTFRGPYSENAEIVVTLPPDVRDEDGRALSNPELFPKTFRIGEPAPAMRFAAAAGVIERNAGSALPVMLQNVEEEIPFRHLRVGSPRQLPTDSEVIEWTRRFNTEVSQAGFQGRSMLSDIPGVESGVLRRRLRRAASENAAIALKQPGYYIVEIESARHALHNRGRQYLRAAVLVTNLAVHFKTGPENALAWVTRLDTGEPVADAAIGISDCNGATMWEGRSNAQGLARIDRPLPMPERCEPGHYGFLVSARAGDDLGLALTQWSYVTRLPGAPPFAPRPPFPAASAGWTMHSVFDRSLLRAGETVHMKHYVRREKLDGLALADLPGPHSAEITHVATRTSATVPLTWTADGTSTASWRIPDDAKLGAYVVRLSYASTARGVSGTFRVEEFRLPTMRAELRSEASQYFNATEVPYRMRLAYLAGGSAQQTVTLRTRLTPHRARFEGFEDFTFPGPVYWQQSAPARLLDPMRVELNEEGEARAVLRDIPRRDAPTEVTTEMEFADASGEIQTVSSLTRLWPSAIVLGMKPSRRLVADPDPARYEFQTVALDLDGNLLPGTPVRIEMFSRTRRSEREIGPDGAERWQQYIDDDPLGEVCSGRTDARAVLTCAVTPPRTGPIVFKANSTDATGNVARMELNAFFNPNQPQFSGVAAAQANVVDLYPDRVGYRPGDIARIQFRVPYDRTRVLITVEREGIAESRVEVFDAGTREFEVPIRGTYAPNVYVSVLMVNGRRGQGRATEQADPDKPVFFHAVRELRVAPSAYAIAVQVTPDREVYAPRESAKVRIKATLPNGTPARNAEVALAAVDDALLELAPNTTWKLLESLLRRRPPRVANSTALTQVIGDRALPQDLMQPQAKPAPAKPAMAERGSDEHDASAGAPRELFDTLLKWQARIRLDDNGEATVEVPLNDSLTAFRIVAVAHWSAEQFGTGEARVRSTTALAIVAGLPPLVREGDAFRAMTTLRNTSDKTMRVEFSAKAQRTSPGGTTAMPATTLNVELKPGESREVSWQVTVPVNTELLTWELAARNRAGTERDAARIAQKVVPAVPVTVQQATLTQIDKPLDMKVALPREAIAGRGGVAVGMRAKLGDGLDGVRYFMSGYPYFCLEQKMSRAIALQDEAAWRRIVAALASYLDADGLLRYYPDPRFEGSDVLTSYVLAIAQEAKWSIPEELRARMTTGLRAFVEGRVIRRAWAPRADLEYRKLAAIDALSRYGGAQPSMLQQISTDPNAWPTSAVLDWLQIHQRNRSLPNSAAAMEQAQQIIRSRLNLQGTTMGFSTEREDYLWWLMVSPDLNAVRAVLALLEEKQWQEDIPRMVRGALQRQRGGHWSTTTANAWGVLAMVNFSRRFEATPVSGQTQASLGGRTATQDWTAKAAAGPLRFDWPEAAQTLRIDHRGGGKPWVTVQSLAAVRLKAPFSSGYQIVKRVEAVQRKAPNVWSRGDVLRVTLELEAQNDMTHVVVSDPIPAGSTVLGSGLGRDSTIASAPQQPGRRYWQPPFEERTFAGYRAYYTFVPKGKWTTQYSVRLNNDGRFELPQTRVEAMYAPEMFGELPNPPITVRP